jgi:undecaprenyl-diphosphatase
MNLDWNLFLDINHLAGQSAGLDLVGRFFAVDAFWLFGVVLIALWFWPGAVEARRAREQRVVNAAIALAFALLSAHFIGVFFYRARPFVAHAVTQLIPYPPDASFPSDHTTVAFALIVALWPVLGRTRWFWIAWGALIGLARVMVGVHYPTDVLGGALLGAAWGALALMLSPRLARVELPVIEWLAQWKLA